MDWKFGDLVDSAALPQLRLRIFKICQTLGRRIDRILVHIRRIGGGVNRRWTVVPGKPRRSRLKFPVATLAAVALVPVKLPPCLVYERSISMFGRFAIFSICVLAFRQ